jgi:eukaryotic-like serine/threonine-protein kinase
VRAEPLEHIAEAIANRTPVDWAGAAASLEEADRAVLRELEALAAMAALHAGDVNSSAESHDGPLATAATWGGLKLLETLGEGAFGQVFRAWDPQLDREVALKLLHPGVVPSLVGAVSEGRLLARVKHANVVTVYAAEEHAGQIGLSMEFIRGRTLESLIEALGPFGARETAGIGIDLCRALAAVHGAGLLHRDIKAQNVMRESGGRIVLMDFGAGAWGTSSSGLIGTPLYLAPEVLTGGQATPASDLYSLGVLLFHLSTGSYPVAEPSIDAMIAAHGAGAVQRLRDLRPDLPDQLITAVERATQLDPKRRYTTAGALEEGLLQVVQEQTTPTTRPARRWPAPLKKLVASCLVIAGLALGATEVTSRWNRPPAGHAPAFRSIAVLPVRNLTDNADQEFIADGLTELLIGDLSRIKSLKVIAYRSSMAFKGSSDSPVQIADQLGVEMLLDGSIRRAAARDGIQVTANLVHPRSGRVVWSRTEEHGTADWYRLEQYLFDLLEFEIRGASTISYTQEIDPQAFEDYLRGRYQWNKRTREAVLAARDLFQGAIERQPSFAAAHAGLADAYLILGAFSWLPMSDVFPKAAASARQAITLDETLAAPHATLGYLLANDGQWPVSEREFERALALDPNYATARQWYALCLRAHDRTAAVAQIERARDLDPLSEIIGTDVAAIYRTIGRYDDAIEQLRRVIRVHPNFAEGHRQLAELLERMQRYPEALAAFEAADKVAPRDPLILAGLATAYGRAGRPADAGTVYRKLRDEAASHFVPLFALMTAAAAAGDFRGAFTYGRRGVELPESQTLAALTGGDIETTRLSPLKGRPEFDQLVREAVAARKR